jgi:hypothetical protein
LGYDNAFPILSAIKLALAYVFRRWQRLGRWCAQDHSEVRFGDESARSSWDRQRLVFALDVQRGRARARTSSIEANLAGTGPLADADGLDVLFEGLGSDPLAAGKTKGVI